MMLYILFRTESEDSNDMPWVVDATDEWSIESCDGFPDDYKAEREKPLTKELLIEIPDKAVESLFRSPMIKGKVVQEPHDQ